jgi:hypothetical protein
LEFTMISRINICAYFIQINNFELTIKASDGQLSSKTKVVIDVLDVNDCPPKFWVHNININCESSPWNENLNLLVRIKFFNFFYIVLNKDWKISWSKQSFTGLGPEDRCSSKFTSCLPMVGGSLRVLRLLPPLKLVTMI